MAKSWSGFLPQNLNAKEQWALLEACEATLRGGESDGHVVMVEGETASSVHQGDDWLEALTKDKQS